MRKLAVLLVALLCAGAAFGPSAKAFSINVELGDQPYYSHGPGYWVGRSYYVWAPGHWVWRHHHRYWIHGHYRIR
jgi:hypothetical protein